MKKRILIALIVLVLCAGIGLSLYFFVFKKYGLNEEDAANLVISAAIDIDAIQTYEGAPNPNLNDFNTGAGDNNLITKKPLTSISRLTFIDEVWDSENAASTIERIKDIAALCANFMKTQNIKQENVYTSTKEDITLKMKLQIIDNEILFIIQNTSTQNFEFVSFFYDSVYNEYEYIYIANTSTSGNLGCSVERFKANEEELISYESYSLSGITGDSISAGISAGLGQTEAIILDYANQTYKTISLDSATPDDNTVLSNYIYGIYKSFDENLSDSKTAVSNSTNPIAGTFYSDSNS